MKDSDLPVKPTRCRSGERSSRPALFAWALLLALPACLPVTKSVVVVDQAHKAPVAQTPVEKKAAAPGAPAAAAAVAKGQEAVQPPLAPPTAAPALPGNLLGKSGAGEGQRALLPAPEVKAGIAWPGAAEFERRLATHGNRLSRWQEIGAQLADGEGGGQPPAGWAECGQKMEELVAGYKKLRDRPSEGGGAGDNGEFWRLNNLELSFLDGECPALLRTGSEMATPPPPPPPPPPSPEEKGREVVKLVGQGSYQEVLAAYETLRKNHPAVAAAPGPRQAYGMALLHTGRVEGAIEVLAKELGPLEGDEQGGRWRQHQLVADLMVAAGRQAEAKAIYLRLADYFAAMERESLWVADQLAVVETSGKEAKGLSLYQSLLRTYLAGDGRRVPEALTAGALRLEADFPASHLARSGRTLVKKAEEQVAGYVRQQLALATNQIREKNVKQALAILTELQVGLTPELSEQVQKAMDEARLAEKSELEAKPLGADQGLAGKWAEANHLLELQKYDEAILIFHSLAGSEFAERAQAKQVEAANQAAAALRREAALLFSKAAKIPDPAQQAEALQASRRLLEQILAKYPNAEVVGKVKQNLRILDEQLHRLAPLPGATAPATPESGIGLQN